MEEVLHMCLWSVKSAFKGTAELVQPKEQIHVVEGQELSSWAVLSAAGSIEETLA